MVSDEEMTKEWERVMNTYAPLPVIAPLPSPPRDMSDSTYADWLSDHLLETKDRPLPPKVKVKPGDLVFVYGSCRGIPVDVADRPPDLIEMLNRPMYRSFPISSTQWIGHNEVLMVLGVWLDYSYFSYIQGADRQPYIPVEKVVPLSHLGDHDPILLVALWNEKPHYVWGNPNNLRPMVSPAREDESES